MNFRPFRNARKAIQQIKEGKWVPRWNDLDKTCLTAEQGNLTLWLGNGPFFCDINNANYFGLLWRHWVWWAAARQLKRSCELRNKPKLPVL